MWTRALHCERDCIHDSWIKRFWPVTTKLLSNAKVKKTENQPFLEFCVIENCVCVLFLAGGECDAWKPMSWKYFSCAVGGAINSNSLITGCDKTLQYPPRFSHNTLLRGEDRIIMGKSLSCTSKTWDMFAVVLLLHFLIPHQWIDLISIVRLAISKNIRKTFIYGIMGCVCDGKWILLSLHCTLNGRQWQTCTDKRNGPYHVHFHVLPCCIEIIRTHFLFLFCLFESLLIVILVQLEHMTSLQCSGMMDS